LHSAQNGAMNGTQSPSSIDLLAAVNVRLDLLGLPKVQAVEAGQAAADALIAPLLKRQRELSRRLADRLAPSTSASRPSSTTTSTASSQPLACRGERSCWTCPAWPAPCPCPVDADDYSSRTDHELPPRQWRAAQPGATTGAPRPASSTSPRAACRSRRQESRAARGLRRSCSTGPSPRPPRPTGTADHLRTRTSPAACFVSLHLRPLVIVGVPGPHPRDAGWRRGSSCPARMVANLDFVEGIFGNAGDPYLPENDAALDPTDVDGAHRLRHPRPAPDHRHQEVARPPAPRRRHGAPGARRHVLERPGRGLQRGQGLQGLRPRRARRHGDDHRRQLLRLLQEGGQDANLHVRQSLWWPRRSTPAVPWSSRAGTRARSSVNTYAADAPPSPTSSPRPVSASRLQPGGSRVHGGSRTSSSCRPARASPCTTARSRHLGTRRNAHPVPWGHVTYLRPQRLPGRTDRRCAGTRCSGPSSARPRRPRCATNRRPSPAAASPRSPSR
jgi:hypothetical protein